MLNFVNETQPYQAPPARAESKDDAKTNSKLQGIMR